MVGEEMQLLFILCLISQVYSAPTASPTVAELVPTLYANVSFPFPAFVSYSSVFTQTRDLLITQFSAADTGSVYSVSDIASYFEQARESSNIQLKVNTLGNDYAWPNVAATVASGIFSSEETSILCGGDSTNCSLIIVPDGFLPPGKKTGGMYILPARNTGPVAKIALAPSEKNWFFHHANWFDLDNDGLVDIIAARANVDNTGHSKGELVWLRHPEKLDINTPWEMKKLSDGPDVITMLQQGNDGLLYVFAAEFFGEKLSMTTLKPGGDSVSMFVEYKVLDSTTGPSEDLHLADVDGDGVSELVVTSHEGGEGGKIFCYELPANLIPGSGSTDMALNWEKIVLGSGFEVEKFGPNQAAPGFIYPIQIGGSLRPTWIVAGDGSMSVHIMYPLENFNGNPYAHSTSKIISVKGTVGTLAVDDLNGDGILDMIVPDYDNGRLYFYGLL